MPDVQRVCWFAYPPAIEGELGLRLVATISGRLSMTITPSPFSLSDCRPAINVMQSAVLYHSLSDPSHNHRHPPSNMSTSKIAASDIKVVKAGDTYQVEG